MALLLKAKPSQALSVSPIPTMRLGLLLHMAVSSGELLDLVIFTFYSVVSHWSREQQFHALWNAFNCYNELTVVLCLDKKSMCFTTAKH